MSRDGYAQLVALAEQELRELGRTIDTCVDDSEYERALLALAHRSRALFTGFLDLAESSAPVAALVLLRPAVEINLTLRFLKTDPELHAQLWVADGEYETLKLVREFERDSELVAKVGEPSFPDGWQQEMESFVEEVRQRAIAAGVKGVGPKGSVMPSMWSIAFEHGDLATREAYTLAYRSLGHDVHGSSRAFQRGRFVACEEGGVRFEEFGDAERLLGSRALNATTFASSLCIISDPLGLDVLEQASTLKSLLLRAPAE